MLGDDTSLRAHFIKTQREQFLLKILLYSIIPNAVQYREFLEFSQHDL